MTNEEQRPASAAFMGAQRAPSYFEEWPTETGQAARGENEGDSLSVPQKGDISELLETSPESEQMLLAVTEPPTDRRAARAEPTEPDEDAAPEAEAALVVQTPALRAQSKQRGSWLDIFRGKPSRAQLAAQQFAADQTAVRMGSWPRSVGVLVANPKGGTGKTPSALALGGVFANVRGGQTVVYEVTDDPGALSVRAEGPARGGIAELVRDADQIRGAGHLTTYVAQQTSYAAVVGTPGDRAPLDAAAVQRASDLLGFFYPVRIMDSGNQPSSSAFEGAVSRADVLVIPVAEALDSLAAAQQLVRHLHRLGGHAAALARNAIILRVNDGRQGGQEVSTLITDSLAAAKLHQVFDIPWDNHIAQRSTITLSNLAPATVQAYTRVAAAIVHQLNGK